jgi:hypothetical protein
MRTGFKSIIFVFVLARALLACMAVDGDRILAKHLAMANQDFRALEPAIVIGLSPHAGITRVIRSGELRAIASRHHAELFGPPLDLCFVRDDSNSTSRPPSDAKPQAAPEVTRGERVHVEVLSGAAKIHFEANAESSGRAGDSVLIRNPANGRLFQAKVSARGKVSVQK